jgi:hypothetical protein
MAMTYFQKFTKDDGTPIEVEYSFSPGSETTYSPAYGACGGDACEVEIIESWPEQRRSMTRWWAARWPSKTAVQNGG